MTVGQLLGDHPAHRIPHNDCALDSQGVEDPGCFISDIGNGVRTAGPVGSSVAAMIRHDHPETLGQAGYHPEECHLAVEAPPVEQQQRHRIGRPRFANEELPFAYKNRAPWDPQRPFLRSGDGDG
jgi:hypothetical protein